MSKKPHFLKSHSEFAKQTSEYGQLLNARKRGESDDFYMSTPQLRAHYKKLCDIQRGYSTLTESIERQTLFDQTYLKLINSGESKRDARLRALSDVSAKCGITVQSVRRSIDLNLN